MIKSWDDYKVRKLTKHDYKLINKAVSKIQDEKIDFKFRDALKWSIIALLDEIEEIEDVMDKIHISQAFDKMFVKEERKPIALLPVVKKEVIAPCTQIIKDNTFKLIS